MNRNEENEQIDFVITWVDGNDKDWLNEKNKYLNLKGDSNINRFRDCNNLQYLFRGIEKYAPWVNKIFFVTWGHIPNWLNVNNPKLEIVNHRDFIPKEFLPTFNSNVIEMNLFRIKNLSEKFVLFNDDLFILKKLKKEDFFENDLPKDMYIEYKKRNCSKRHITLRNNYASIINKYFVKQNFVKNNLGKIFSFNYGIHNLENLKMLKYKDFQDIYSAHLTQAFLKESFKHIYSLEKEKIDNACNNRFRADSDLGYALCRYFQLFSGSFVPSKTLGKYFVMSDNNRKLIKAIYSQKYKIICINDAYLNINFDKAISEINNALEVLLSEKSRFEI